MNTSARLPAEFSKLTAATVGMALLFSLAIANPARARTGGDSTIERYAVNLEDRESPQPPETVAIPLPVSIGFAGMVQKRELAFEGYDTSDVEMRHLDAYVGLDVTPWLTLRALVGVSDFQPDVADADRLSADTEWGFVAEARLLNWRVDPVLCNIAWIRFDASAQFLDAAAKDGGDKVEWQERYADLTVNLLTIPPENDTFKSVALFAGPAFSWIDGEVTTANGMETDFDEDQLLGLTTGLGLIPHDNISIKIELQIFNDISYGASMGFHF